MRCYRRQLKTTVIIEGGGGGGTSTITIERLGESSLTIIKGDAATIEFNFTSVDNSGEDTGDATGVWYVGNTKVATTTIYQGKNSFDITQYLHNGDNKIKLQVTDSVGSIKTYSMKSDWNKKVSGHFSVYEFACSDKSDTVLIDTELISILEQVRAHFGAAVHINSGYRTPAYNISIGGSPNSQHCKGTAADIWIKGVDPIRIALYLSSLPYFAKRGGIGYYSRTVLTGGFVHVDVRATKSRWISKTGTKYLSVSNIMPTIKQGSKDATGGVSYAVTVLQRHLGVTADGIFGAGTKAKLIEWQKAHGLAADGICGAATWSSF